MNYVWSDFEQHVHWMWLQEELIHIILFSESSCQPEREKEPEIITGPTGEFQIIMNITWIFFFVPFSKNMYQDFFRIFLFDVIDEFSQSTEWK